MAKQRIVNTKFWDDSYIASLDPFEKLIFLYLLTSPLTNISGVYELPLKRAAFDIGLEALLIERILEKFEANRKIVYENGWVGIRNFIKHQTLNPKVKQGIFIELRKAPQAVVERLDIDYSSLYTAYDRLSDSNSNPNMNINHNIDETTLGKLRKFDEEKRRLAKRMKSFEH